MLNHQRNSSKETVAAGWIQTGTINPPKAQKLGFSCHPVHRIYLEHRHRFKGKLGDFILLAESLNQNLTKQSFKRRFSPKSPEVGQKVQKSPNKDQTSMSYCRNPQNFTYELLYE